MPQLGSIQIYTTITNIKELFDNNIIKVGDFNTPLTVMDRSSKQINKETRALNDTLDQVDFIDIHRAFHPRATEYTFFLSAHGTISRKDHIWVTKQVSTNTKRLKLFPAYSQTTILKLELNHKEKFARSSNIWRLRTILLKNDSINQETKNQFKQFMETNENENTMVQNLWNTAKAVLREKFIAIQACLKKQEKKERKSKLSPKIAEGNNTD